MTTRLVDVIQPSKFLKYQIKRTMELSALLTSGIVVHDSELDKLASTGNKLINMPFFNDLTGDSEIMKDEGNITVGKITSGQDIARLQARVNAWGANGLSGYLSQSDPMGAIADLTAAYWARQLQKNLISILAGLFSVDAIKTAKLLDVTGSKDPSKQLLSGETFLDATQLMGDAKESITAVAMHSALENYARKINLVQDVPVGNQGQLVRKFMGKDVIIDDSLPFDSATKTGTFYLFGRGAFGLGNGKNSNIVGVEVDRNKLSSSGEENLVNRRLFILHPRGIKWTEKSVAGEFPTNAELAKKGNWEMVYEHKAIRLAALTCKIG